MFFWYFRACPEGRRVHPGSLGRAPGGVGFIRVSMVHLGAPRVLSGSCGVVWFIRARTGCRLVHSNSYSSFGRAPDVFLFIWGRLVHSAALRESSV